MTQTLFANIRASVAATRAAKWAGHKRLDNFFPWCKLSGMSMTHDYHKPPLADLQAQIARNNAEAIDRANRIHACVVEDTDCALSMWANDTSAGKLNKQLELAQLNWHGRFLVLYQNGARVDGQAVTFKSKFCNKQQYKWIIGGKWYQSYGRFDTETPRRWKNFLKLGFEWREEMLPAHTAQIGGHYLGAPIFTIIVPDDTQIITTYA